MKIKRDSTPEEKNAYNRAYYANHREELRAAANAIRYGNIEHHRAWARANTKKQRAKDPDAMRKWEAEYRAKNRAKIRAYTKNYVSKNYEKVKAYRTRYYASTLPSENEKRRRQDPAYRLLKNCRIRIWESLKKCSAKKTHRTVQLLGCTPHFLREYLEKQFTFENGFTWNNYGTRWEVDHIMPVSSFDLLDSVQLKKCFHYTNCQPLGKIENIKKGDKLPHELNPTLMQHIGHAIKV